MRDEPIVLESRNAHEQLTPNTLTDNSAHLTSVNRMGHFHNSIDESEDGFSENRTQFAPL